MPSAPLPPRGVSSETWGYNPLLRNICSSEIDETRAILAALSNHWGQGYSSSSTVSDDYCRYISSTLNARSYSGKPTSYRVIRTLFLICLLSLRAGLHANNGFGNHCRFTPLPRLFVSCSSVSSELLPTRSHPQHSTLDNTSPCRMRRRLSPLITT